MQGLHDLLIDVSGRMLDIGLEADAPAAVVGKREFSLVHRQPNMVEDRSVENILGVVDGLVEILDGGLRPGVVPAREGSPGAHKHRFHRRAVHGPPGGAALPRSPPALVGAIEHVVTDGIDFGRDARLCEIRIAFEVDPPVESGRNPREELGQRVFELCREGGGADGDDASPRLESPPERPDA